jgi:hypothetical protein
MALPALIKAWERVWPATVGGVRSGTLLDLKNALVNHATHPWTVIGSCDRSTSGMDGVDRWVIGGDIAGNPGPGIGPISWIVLGQPSMGGFQILLFLDSSELINDPNGDLFIPQFSPQVGYGSANGGGDGTTTSIPTALDGKGMGGSHDLLGQNTGTAKVLNIISATDGTSWRIIISEEASGLPVLCLGYETVQNAGPDWTYPRVAWVVESTVASGVNCFRWEVLQETEVAHGWVPGDGAEIPVGLRLIGPMLNTVEGVDELQVDGRVILHPHDLFNDTFEQPGYGEGGGGPVGQLPDLYYVSRNPGGGHAVDLDTFPVSGQREFVCLGDVVAGWLDDATTDLYYNGAPAPPPPAFISKTTVQQSGSPMDIGKPAGTQEGDVLIFLYIGANGDNKSNIDAHPAGWVTKHATSVNMNGTAFQFCDVLVAGASEPATYQWLTKGGQCRALATILCYRPAHGTQLDVIAGAPMGVNATNHTAPDATTLQDAATMVVAYMFKRSPGAHAIVTPPATMTERENLNANGISWPGIGLAIYDEAGPATAGLYSGRLAISEADTDGYGITLAIRSQYF